MSNAAPAADTPSSAAAPAPARASVPVVTDTTAASDEELREAAALFLPGPAHAWSFSRASGGVNNSTYFVNVPESERVVLRVYRNGGNTPRVVYEHAVLRALRGRALPFCVPEPLPVLADVAAASAGGGGGGEGAGGDAGPRTFALLRSGAAAAVFRLIPGGPAGLSAARAIGAATAALVAALADVRVDAPPVNPLYRNLYDAHWKVDRASFAARCAGPEFDAVRADMDELLEHVAATEALSADILAAGGLPEQIINADLHTDNVLVAEVAPPLSPASSSPATSSSSSASPSIVVTGVLDFEFAARDWRVMEMVVGLSKYAGLSSPLPSMIEYIGGYASAGGRLTRREAALVPRLIISRICNNVVYFVGRAIAGEDSIEPISGRAGVYAKRCRWLVQHEAELVRALEAAGGLVVD